MMGKTVATPGGELEEGDAVPEQQRETQAGIIPQLCEDLFHRIGDAAHASSNVTFSVEARANTGLVSCSCSCALEPDARLLSSLSGSVICC